jgi:dTDP-glucose 4,6-dehydratase
MRFRGSTIFVTGGAAFIGSAVVRPLLRDSHARVISFDKLPHAANPDAADNSDCVFERTSTAASQPLREWAR